MAIVKDIMTTELVVVGPDLSLRDWVELLALAPERPIEEAAQRMQGNDIPRRRGRKALT